MIDDTPPFPALIVSESGIEITDQADSKFLYSGGDTLVQVLFSCINYKDALALTTGRKMIIRSFPLIPGIDYVGEVISSTGNTFKEGDKVIQTGHGVGESISGGFAKYASSKSDWLVKLPESLDEKQAMVCGTAGLTAALSVIALKNSGRLPDGGKVVVSGASGGVGSFAVLLLSKLNYEVIAISRTTASDYLTSLGASEILTREAMSSDSRPLERSKWDGAIDCVGGKILARLLAETNYGGVVATCGLAASSSLSTTVMPFILRGVRLEGVDSVFAPTALRQQAWDLLGTHLTAEDTDRILTGNVNLNEVTAACEKIMSGEVNGRFLVTPSLDND